jgi:hypothetical protein
VRLIKAVENVTTVTGASRKLENEGKKQVVTGLLVEIFEVEIKVGNDGCSSFADSHNVFNDGGTGGE